MKDSNQDPPSIKFSLGYEYNETITAERKRLKKRTTNEQRRK